MRYKWIVLSNTTIGVLMASIDSNIVLIARHSDAKLRFRRLNGTDDLRRELAGARFLLGFSRTERHWT